MRRYRLKQKKQKTQCRGLYGRIFFFNFKNQIMKNFKKLSRRELSTIAGGLENNCTCGAGSSIEFHWHAESAEACFSGCKEYRKRMKELQEATTTI